MIDRERIYPRHLPTQASGRWSTTNPPLTNFPSRCINPYHSKEEHERDSECWSIRDTISYDDDEVMVSWDYDNIEGRIGAIILNDTDDLEAFTNRYDLHTINCCYIFNYILPKNLVNPHTSVEDIEWRHKYKWQGKDTRQRILSKNFYHGLRYAISPNAVLTIKDIERFGLTKPELLILAKRYIKRKEKTFDRKQAMMEDIRRSKQARSLFGQLRQFYDMSDSTAKEGFNHIIQGTVADIMDGVLIAISRKWPNSRLMHNAHDGAKVAFPKDACPSIVELREMIEMPLSYKGREVMITAEIKVS